MGNFFRKMKEGIERFIPMTIGSLVLFTFIVYLLFIVGRSIFQNYHANQDLSKNDDKITQMQSDIRALQNKIAYEQTYTFQEIEARALLGYRASGETVISLPFDTVTDQSGVATSSVTITAAIAVPNYRLWWKYFFN